MDLKSYHYQWAKVDHYVIPIFAYLVGLKSNILTEASQSSSFPFSQQLTSLIPICNFLFSNFQAFKLSDLLQI
jgi:hypothetical protein